MRSRLLVALVAFGWASLSLVAAEGPNLTLFTRGEIVLEPQSASAKLETVVGVAFGWDDATFNTEAGLTDSEWQSLTVGSMLTLEDWTLTAGLDLPTQTSSTLSGRASLAGTLEEIGISLDAVTEPGALGLGLNVQLPEASPVTRAAVGFNLDSSGSIQTDSCALDFTFFEADFSLSCPPCEAAFGGTVLLEKEGLKEVYLAASHVGSLPLGVTLGASLLFQPESKTLDIQPSLMLENPACFDIYAGLDWDGTTERLSGIKLFGLGMRCEWETVRLRGLWSLDASQITLVPSPYWSLIGLVWRLPVCCGLVGEGSVAAFFGSDNLFDLEEILAEVILPLSDRSTISLSASLPATGASTLSLGWSFSF